MLACAVQSRLLMVEITARTLRSYPGSYNCCCYAFSDNRRASTTTNYTTWCVDFLIICLTS